MNGVVRRWSVAGLILALAGLVATSGGSGLAHEDEETPTPPAMSQADLTMPAHPAAIYRGGCGDAAEVAYRLRPVKLGAPLVPTAAPDEHAATPGEAHLDDHGAPASALGAAAAVPGASSSTIVPVGLAEFLAADHTIAVRWSEDDEAEAAIACGSLGGLVADGDLVVGLPEMNNSGAVGMAWLRDNGDGTTGVTLFLAYGLFAHTEEDQAVAAAAPHVDSETVAVTLTEFAISLPETTFVAGVPYRFAIANAGTVPHELVIERAGAAHEPLADGGAVAMVHAIPPNGTATLDWTFAKPGSYHLACHEPGHFESGQVLAIEVVG